MSRAPVPPVRYQRIADSLRRQIDSGSLPAGARVPSTRELARTWKVATATAAHALQSLVRGGVLIAQPRSGTIVAGRRTDATSALSRARVIAAAIAMADDEGLSALSIRGLAARLRVPVMSLYRHVRSKDDILALMADAALAELTLAEPPPRGWRAQLEHAARVEWQIFRKHPWLARVVHISRPSALPNALAYVNWVMRALDDTRLDGVARLRLHVLLHAFIQGMAVNLEAEAQAIADTGIGEEDYMQSQAAKYDAVAADGRYPYFAKMMRELPDTFALDIDELFERGLTSMLDGFAMEIKRRS
ncbi:MAG: TetR/AcrR family transcriptional regulator C-terminal domain-containing protein [bacterium]